jgi:hypothetical protein
MGVLAKPKILGFNFNNDVRIKWNHYFYTKLFFLNKNCYYPNRFINIIFQSLPDFEQFSTPDKQQIQMASTSDLVATFIENTGNLDTELSDLVSIDGWKTCEGMVCGVMTPEFCKCPDAGPTSIWEERPDAGPTSIWEEHPVAKTTRPASVVAELGIFTPGMRKWLRQKADELYANQHDSAFPTPFRITTGLPGCLRLTVYADTVEDAGQLLDDFMMNVKCYVAARETFAFVEHTLAENIDNFFSAGDVRKLGPYTFSLVETTEGLFIQMTRKMVSLKDYQAAFMEFWNIHNFFLWLNTQPGRVHIQNVLRQMSNDINHAIETRNFTLKHKQKLPNHGPFQPTLADFLQPTLADFLQPTLADFLQPKISKAT